MTLRIACVVALLVYVGLTIRTWGPLVVRVVQAVAS